VDNFLPQKPLKAGEEMLLHLYCSESCFWAKALRAFELFSWLLAFAKQKQVGKSNQTHP
jgi:hypothetical protein